MISNKKNAKWLWSKTSKKIVHAKKRIATELCAHYRNTLDYSTWVRTKTEPRTLRIELSRFWCIQSC